MRQTIVLALLCVLPTTTCAEEARPTCWIGYTEGRNDLPDGQFTNWVTNRACLVRADGSGRRVLVEELTRKPHSWTPFAGWSPDGTVALIGSHWESPENAAWERRHKTFRMTQGWLSDTCLLDLATNRITNVTAVERSARTAAASCSYTWPKAMARRRGPSPTCPRVGVPCTGTGSPPNRRRSDAATRSARETAKSGS